MEVNYFGKTFNAVDWHLILGNNNEINPCDDELSIREKFWNNLTSGQVVLDIGAGFGLYTLPVLMQGCIVHSFEPILQFLNIMTESVNMNDGFADRYYGYSFGLWNETEYPKELSDHWLDFIKKDSMFVLSTLDKVTKDFKRVDIVKIDSEGAELGILEGATEMIKKHKPLFIIEDHNGIYDYCTINNTGQKITHMLTDYGYNITLILYGEALVPVGSGRYFIMAVP